MAEKKTPTAETESPGTITVKVTMASNEVHVITNVVTVSYEPDGDSFWILGGADSGFLGVFPRYSTASIVTVQPEPA